ncbi:MAG: DUF4278 domain-containing protein [Nodosilinea sp.]
MSLKYRGIDYNAAASKVAISEEVIGRYRGAVVTRHVTSNEQANGHVSGLKYRGAVVR